MIYRDEDFPMGLRCPDCGHVFTDGERYSSVLTGFQDDIPMTRLVCPECAGGEA